MTDIDDPDFKDTTIIDALNFNQLANSHQIPIRMKLFSEGWHLQSCMRWKDCACFHILRDINFILNPIPSLVPEEESINYFNGLSFKNQKGLWMCPDGHLYNCIYSKNAEGHLIEMISKNGYDSGQMGCVCNILKKHSEYFLDIPHNNWYRPPDAKEIETLKCKWSLLNYNESEDVQAEKFNIISRLCGKTYKLVNTKESGYHLDTCPIVYGIKEKETCYCYIPLLFPSEFFIPSKGMLYKIRGEGYHMPKCSRLQLFEAKLEKIPENLECNCQKDLLLQYAMATKHNLCNNNIQYRCARINMFPVYNCRHLPSGNFIFDVPKKDLHAFLHQYVFIPYENATLEVMGHWKSINNDVTIQIYFPFITFRAFSPRVNEMIENALKDQINKLAALEQVLMEQLTLEGIYKFRIENKKMKTNIAIPNHEQVLKFLYDGLIDNIGSFLDGTLFFNI